MRRPFPHHLVAVHRVLRDLGPLPVSRIAGETGIALNTVYRLLTDLQRRGAVAALGKRQMEYGPGTVRSVMFWGIADQGGGDS